MATYKVLAHAQLGTSAANICAPSGVTWIIGAITVKNTDSVSRTAYLYVNGTAVSDQIWKADIPADDGFDGNGVITLESGATLKGKASAASVVNVTVFGVEK